MRTLLLASLIFSLCTGCAAARSAWEKALEYAVVGAITAGAAIAGAIVAGPAGAGIGGFAGAVVGNSIGDSASYHAGETFGRPAHEAELERLRQALMGERIKASQLQQSIESLWSLVPWIVGGLLLWLWLRNREHLTFKDGLDGFVRGLMHSLFGGQIGKPKEGAS